MTTLKQQLEARSEDPKLTEDERLQAFQDSNAICPVCEEKPAERCYDRHGIYSGRACEACSHTLPGQGSMRNYEAEEPIDEPD